MKALILAAGFGSRLMPLTQNQPKCMVSYQGVRIIDYEIKALKTAVDEIAVVGGYSAQILKEYLKNFGITKFYENKNFSQTNMVQTLFCARDFLQSCIEQKQDLIISYADIVYFEDTIKKLSSEKSDFAIIIDKDWHKLWNKRFSDPLSDAESLKLDKDKIIELGKKAKNLDEIQGQYIGLFKFSHNFLIKVLQSFDELDPKGFYDGKDFANMYMTSFLQILIDKFHNAKAVEIYGNWCEIDFKSDLDLDLKNL